MRPGLGKHDRYQTSAVAATGSRPLAASCHISVLRALKARLC